MGYLYFFSLGMPSTTPKSSPSRVGSASLCNNGSLSCRQKQSTPQTASGLIHQRRDTKTTTVTSTVRTQQRRLMIRQPCGRTVRPSQQCLLLLLSDGKFLTGNTTSLCHRSKHHMPHHSVCSLTHARAHTHAHTHTHARTHTDQRYNQLNTHRSISGISY